MSSPTAALKPWAIRNAAATPSAVPTSPETKVYPAPSDEELLDQMSALGAHGAGHAHFGTALGGEHGEDEHDQQDADTD